MRWVVSVKGVLLSNSRVLLAKNERSEWELPGGQMDPGERPVETLKREVLEETGLAVEVGQLLVADTFQVVPGSTVLVVAYRCQPAGSRDLVLSSEHEELAWHDLDGLCEIALPDVYARAIGAANGP